MSRIVQFLRNGKKASEETKKKISIATSGNKNGFYNRRHTEEAKRKIGQFFSKSIVRSDGKIYKSITEAAKELSPVSNKNENSVVARICSCLKNRTNTAYGYKWRYCEATQ